MGQPGRTSRLARSLLLMSGAVLTLTPRIVAQTADDQSQSATTPSVESAQSNWLDMPGLVVGGFPLAERLHLSLAAGMQIAVTEFRQYNHRWIVSVRLPF